MNTIFNMFMFHTNLCLLIDLIKGIIEPKFVITWGEVKEKTRKKVFKYYGIGFTISLMLTNIFVQPKLDKIHGISAMVLFICLFCIICLLVGNGNPNLVMRWAKAEKRTRTKVFKYYGVGLISSLVIYQIIAPSRLDKDYSIVMLLLLVCLYCFIALILGTIKPSVAITWGNVEEKTRINVFKCYGMLCIGTFFLLFVAIDVLSK